ncbi:GFA family protein [Piscinibacter terrae]
MPQWQSLQPTTQAVFAASAGQVEGESTEFVRIGDEGTKITFRFCPRCGAAVFHTASGHENSISIPVGAFADPSFPKPSTSVYEERMHSWVSMPAGIDHMD